MSTVYSARVADGSRLRVDALSPTETSTMQP